MQTGSSGCEGKRKCNSNASRNWYSFLPAVFIAIIPKCPFCILSYTSAITVCSSKGLGGYESNWVSWISIAFAAFTFFITLYNYKGQRTLISCLLILTGSSLIVYSELFTGLLQYYFWGSGVLVLGVWINGSFPFFYRKLFPYFNKLTSKKVYG
jgi:hypothetical protein